MRHMTGHACLRPLRACMMAHGMCVIACMHDASWTTDGLFRAVRVSKHGRRRHQPHPKAAQEVHGRGVVPVVPDWACVRASIFKRTWAPCFRTRAHPRPPSTHLACRPCPLQGCLLKTPGARRRMSSAAQCSSRARSHLPTPAAVTRVLSATVLTALTWLSGSHRSPPPPPPAPPPAQFGEGRRTTSQQGVRCVPAVYVPCMWVARRRPYTLACAGGPSATPLQLSDPTAAR